MNIVADLKKILYVLAGLFVTNGHLTALTKVTIASGAALGVVGVAYLVVRKCFNGKATQIKMDSSENVDHSTARLSMKTDFAITTQGEKDINKILSNLEREVKKSQKERPPQNSPSMQLYHFSDKEKTLLLGINPPPLDERLKNISRQLDEAFETRDTWKPNETEAN